MPTLDPFFYFVPAATVLGWESPQLPRMQELRDSNILHQMTIDLRAAFRGQGLVKSVLFVSHRWESQTRPDTEGKQLKAMQRHLDAHAEIQWVWFDYSCLPQKSDPKVEDRTPDEQHEFTLMLNAIVDLYMTSHVLTLLDGSYSSRFWTLMEAWCAMMTASADGVRKALGKERPCAAQRGRHKRQG